MKIRSKFLTKICAFSLVVIFRTLFSTCKKKIHFQVPKSNYLIEEEEKFLICVWHHELVIPVLIVPQVNTAALVSQHQDGSYLADTMQMVGILPVRGSSSKGGAKAMKQLMEITKDHHIVITPDGPRGPREEIKSGIVFLASHSGRAILPTAYACKSYWKIKGSWTDMIIPKPFTTMTACVGEPIYIPPKLKKDQLRHYIGIVQKAMDELNVQTQNISKGFATELAPASPHPEMPETSSDKPQDDSQQAA